MWIQQRYQKSWELLSKKYMQEVKSESVQIEEYNFANDTNCAATSANA